MLGVIGGPQQSGPYSQGQPMCYSRGLYQAWGHGRDASTV